MPAFSTVQAGSTVIGSAVGDSLIVASGDESRFGIGASVIVWPSGQPLRPDTVFDTMDVIDKTGNTLTVLRNEDHALDTIAEGDQIGLTFPQARSSYQQTQAFKIDKNTGYGPVVDLGADALGIVRLIAAISAVDLDGAVDPNFGISFKVDGSFEGIDWGISNPSGVTRPDGTTSYFPWTKPAYNEDLLIIGAADAAPVPAHMITPRYLRIWHSWSNPPDLGVNASATITLELEYY